MNNLATIILAAGNSSRLGQSKQLLKKNNESLLIRTIRLAMQNTPQVFCILGNEASSLSTIIESEVVKKQPLTIVENKNWKTGMGSSIACGIKALPPKTNGVLIMLCDQWVITNNDIKQLINQHLQFPDKIIASHYFEPRLNQQVHGAPAIFPQCYFSELSTLQNTGARNIIKNNLANVVSVDLKNAAFDCDLPEDLVQFYNNQINPEAS